MTHYSIDLHIDETFEDKLDTELLRRAALAALVQQNTVAGELSIVVTGDATIQELDRRYRGVDEPTDVLAFPNETRGPFVEAAGFPRYLGDVVISFPRAQAQAEEAAHETQAELQLLVVHGVLHLLGHDDEAPEDRARMWAEQAQILKILGVRANLPD